MLIIPWLSVPFMGIHNFFRFLPVACFIGLFLAVFSSTANSIGLWETKRPLIPGILVDFPYILGPYFVGTIWIFILTYGNFKNYLIANLLVGIINSGPSLADDIPGRSMAPSVFEINSIELLLFISDVY